MTGSRPSEKFGTDSIIKRVSHPAARRALDVKRVGWRQMHLAENEVELIRLAARVHDLGKIAVPDEVLNKQGRLTDAEFAIMKQHPVTGAEILAKIKRNKDGLWRIASPMVAQQYRLNLGTIVEDAVLKVRLVRSRPRREAGGSPPGLR